MINDRFTKGAIVGMTGAFMQNIYAYLAEIFGITSAGYINVSHAVLFNREYKGILYTLVGLLGYLVISSFWGILFAFIIKYTSSKYYLFKGVIFGGGIWFLVTVIITKVFKLPVLSKNTPQEALFFLVRAVIFGLTIGSVLKFLDANMEQV